MLQVFHSLDAAVRALRIILPKPHDGWRLVKDPLVGCINGLPRLRGWTVATNGIFVVLLASNGKTCQIGHLEWFEADKTEKNAELSDLYAASPKRGKVLKEYVF